MTGASQACFWGNGVSRLGGSVLELQRILGHEQLGTVKIYASLADSDIQEAQRKARCAATPRTSGGHRSKHPIQTHHKFTCNRWRTLHTVTGSMA